MSKKQTCKACFHASFAGPVCRYCRKFYGNAADAISAAALQRRLKGCSFDQLFVILQELTDVVVIDWPGPVSPLLKPGRLDIT